MYTTLIIIQVVLVVYFAITTSFDLHPFNAITKYTPKERRVELIRNLIPMAIILGMTLTPWRWVVGLAGVLWILYFIGGGLTWWVPYLTGKEVFKLPDGETWPQMYQRIFAGTITILPRRKSPLMPTPNLEHTILHSLIIACGIVAIGYALAY